MKSSFLLPALLSSCVWLSLSAQQSTTTPSTQSTTVDQTQSAPAPDQSTPDQNNSSPSNASSSADQENTQTGPAQNPNAAVPTYRVTVVQRTTQAVDYRDRGGTTQLDFRGTSLEPTVNGDAHVTGHTGRLLIDANLHKLAPARSFGPEYLTYVLWAITPEGRASNLGEVIPNDGGNARVQVTTGLQVFGMIVTAEPYFAVSRPSNLVVAENVPRPETMGGIHPITAKFDLLQKGQYTVNITPAQLPATNMDKSVPLQLQEAENSIAIAKAAGADQYAADTLQKAQAYLAQGQDYYRRKQGITPIGAVARAATQSAEDARLLTLEKKQQEQAAAERQRAQDQIQQAQTQADQAAARATAARDEAQRQSEARALADQERQAAEQARLQAEQAAQQAAADRAAAQQQLQQAEQQRQGLVQQQQALSQQAEQARLQAQQAEQERLQVQQQAEQQRQRLLTQLNQVLQTRDTARGLIVNMSDVLFDLNKATLRPGARLRLAKVAGIILAYPDLKLEIDGFTDNTGTPEYNQTLSDKRAKSVSDFLTSQGVPAGAVTTRGMGESNPVASNANAAGRQMNRRVELVVSGTAIGTNVGPGQSGTPGTSSVGTIGPNGSVQPGNAGAQGSGSSTGTATIPAGSQPTGTAPAGSQPNGMPSTPAGAGATQSSPATNNPATSNPSTPPPAPSSGGVPPRF